MPLVPRQWTGDGGAPAIAIVRRAGSACAQNLTPQAQAAEVAKVKRFESGVLRDPMTVTPEMTVRE